MNKKKNIITFAAFLILMVGLGANDAMRGIFSTIFSAHFQLSTAQLSQIVTVSYIGNLVFLAVGGFGVDILGRRKAMLLYTFLWSAAMLLFATTDSYLLLLVGMFFAMGTSTLLNTNMNLITTGMFAVELCYQCTGSSHGTGGKFHRRFLRLCDGGASGAEQSGG